MSWRALSSGSKDTGSSLNHTSDDTGDLGRDCEYSVELERISRLVQRCVPFAGRAAICKKNCCSELHLLNKQLFQRSTVLGPNGR